MATRPPAAARSLADELRTWDEPRLVALLHARPDLLTPVPHELAALAARSTTRASVHRALDGLDAFTLQVAEALAALPDPTARADVSRLLGARSAQLTAPVRRLRDLALLWGPDSALHLVLTVRDALGPHPAGLGPPSVPPLDPTGLADLLAGAPAGVPEVLDRLTRDSPVGAVPRADRPVDVRTARSPVDWLLAHGLLAVSDPEHVVLVREAGLHLRAGRSHRDSRLTPPDLTGSTHDPRVVDAAAGSAAAELLRLVGELGDLWGLTPPPVLRSGGLGVRDLRRTSTALDVPEGTAAFVVELAYVSGLVADDGAVGPVWAPTPTFDTWADRLPAHRWGHLVEAWRTSSRVAALVGGRDDRDTVVGALSGGVERAATSMVRETVLDELASLPAGTAPTRAALLDRLHWRRPRRATDLHDRLAGWTLDDAELLGLTGRGALSSAGRAVVASPAGSGAGATPAASVARAVSRVETAVARMLPTPVDHVLLQADLTAVAPGPLTPDLARLMHAAAEVESRGGATVFRFTAATVRRALDAGWGADQLLDALTSGSRTPVPQPLAYLVRDVARRHGQVRVGAASSYLRSDDESVLRELLADRRAAALQLRSLAPTVLAAQSAPAAVLEVLREIGLAPALESTTGDVVLRRPDLRRTPPRRPPVPRHRDAAVPPRSLLEGVARVLLTGPTATPPAEPGEPFRPAEPAVALASLRAAVAARQRVWIGYADGNGRVDRRVVAPLALDGGQVTAYDHASEQVRTFSVHRVTSVRPCAQ